jgi:hypothetical protein
MVLLDLLKGLGKGEGLGEVLDDVGDEVVGLKSGLITVSVMGEDGSDSDMTGIGKVLDIGMEEIGSSRMGVRVGLGIE